MATGAELFDEFIKNLTEGLEKSGSNKGFVFDGLYPNLKELFLGAKRDELIAELKKVAQKEDVFANDWVPVVAKIDFLTAAERDLRMRYRGGISAFRNCQPHRTFVNTTLEFLQTKMKNVEANEV